MKRYFLKPTSPAVMDREGKIEQLLIAYVSKAVKNKFVGMAQSCELIEPVIIPGYKVRG